MKIRRPEDTEKRFYRRSPSANCQGDDSCQRRTFLPSVSPMVNDRATINRGAALRMTTSRATRETPFVKNMRYKKE